MIKRISDCLRFIIDGIRRLYQRWPNQCWTLIATLIYGLATTIITYPLVFRLSSGICGIGDSYEYIWYFWRTRQIILGLGDGLVHVPWLNHPAGVYHPILLTMMTLDLTALPFVLVLSPVVIYNLQILATFVLGGLSTFWFTYELTGNRRAGLISGFVFAFFPNKMGHVIHGHLPLVVHYWGVLFGLFFWRLVWKPGWRRGIVCGLMLSIALLVHPIHVVYFILPIVLAILLFAGSQLRRGFFSQKRLLALGLAFGIAALIAVPIWWLSISTHQRTSEYLVAQGTVKYSIDLLAFFTPSSYHPVLQRVEWLHEYAEKVFPNINTLSEGLAYPGFLVALLGIWALVKRWRQTWVWGGVAVVSSVLSLGPILKIGGELPVYSLERLQSHIVLPYALIKSLPLVSVSRTPGRINEITSFSLAVLAAFGFSALSHRLTRRHLLFVLTILVSIGILFESLIIWPLPMEPAEIPSVVQALGVEGGEGALLHMPHERVVNHRALFYQTVYQRPMVGGVMIRSQPETEPWETMFYALVKAEQVTGGDIIPRPSLAQRRAWLHYFDVDYVLLHKILEKHVVRYRPLIEDLIGPALDEDDAVIAFAVPSDVSPPAESFLYTIGEKWTSPSQNQDGTWSRWVRGSGKIYVYTTEAQRVRIQFTVESALDLADLALEVDGTLVNRFVVGERSTYISRSLAWEEGMHTILFTRVQGCEGLSDDNKCKVFTLGDIRVVPESELPKEAALDINLADAVRLTRYALDTSDLHPGGTLTVTLNWQALEPLPENYVVFTHLLSEDDVLVAQWDAEPADGRFPTSAWPEGSTFGHSVSLQLPADLPPGNYRLLVGMYCWPSLERLPVLSDVPGAENNMIALEQVRIAP